MVSAENPIVIYYMKRRKCKYKVRRKDLDNTITALSTSELNSSSRDRVGAISPQGCLNTL